MEYVKKHYKALSLLFGTILFLVIGTLVIKHHNENSVPITTGDVTVADLSDKSEDDVLDWCASEGVVCTILKDFSDTITAGGFISQSVAVNTSVNRGQSITIIYSQGSIPKGGRYQECIEATVQYVNRDHLSLEGAYDFFVPEYGETITRWVVEHVNIDWNTIALARAIDYYQQGTTEKDNIRSNLSSDKFTESQVDFAVNHLDDMLGI